MTAAGEPPALEARNLYRFFRAGEEETLALRGVSLTVAWHHRCGVRAVRVREVDPARLPCRLG